ncbi:MAG: large repetitive protein [Solirubrobacterales bacterium]|nr:large repetitive protein [Solirubrobacterales bacterium]
MKRIASSMATALVIAATGASAGPAEASHVECGDEITADTTLDGDLLDCESNGIVIGADDITLDLDGHLIDGDAAEDMTCAKEEICDVGIVLDGHDGVTVKGGTVREFGVGVLVVKGSGSSFNRVRTTRNTFSGVILFKSERTTLRHHLFRANGLETDQAGITVIKTSKLRIAQSEMRDNGDIGLYGEDSEGSKIVDNEIAGNPEAGILMSGSRMLFARNRLDRNGDGIATGGSHITIRNNFITRSQRCGAHCGLGIQVEEGSGNRIVGNLVEDVDTTGISVAGYGPVKHVFVAHNTVRGAGEDAFRVKSVFEPVSHVTLRHNHALGARADGFDVSVDLTRLHDNEANGNGDLGIEAAGGVIDAGGNRASGNGDARQCVNVRCG